MEFLLADFNDAEAYFTTGGGASEWTSLEHLIRRMPIFLHPSRQEGRRDSAIFDPKATNAYLNDHSQREGWRGIPLPGELSAFGNAWDAGRGATLAEWQFSNYPFLWNNVTRSEAAFRAGHALRGMQPLQALVVVAACRVFPTSQSVLYFEQGKAQLDAVMPLGIYRIPIRLLGLTVPPGAKEIEVCWSAYRGRTSRTKVSREQRTARLVWGESRKYGAPTATFELR